MSCENYLFKFFENDDYEILRGFNYYNLYYLNLFAIYSICEFLLLMNFI